MSVVESEPEDVDETFEMMLCLFSQKLSGFKRMFAEERELAIFNEVKEAEVKVELPAEVEDRKGFKGKKKKKGKSLLTQG